MCTVHCLSVLLLLAFEKDGQNLVKRVKGIFGFKVKDANGNLATWIVDVKNGSGKVEFAGKR